MKIIEKAKINIGDMVDYQGEIGTIVDYDWGAETVTIKTDFETKAVPIKYIKILENKIKESRFDYVKKANKYLDDLQIGSYIEVDRRYGGGSGEVLSISDSSDFITYRDEQGKTKSIHASDITIIDPDDEDLYESKKVQEQRRLIPVKIYRAGNLWRCAPDISGYDVVVKAATLEDFAKFLKTIKACDNQTYPKSKRNLTYIKIAQEIADNNDNIVWVWSPVWMQLPNYIILGE